jgi:hypothetical protein
VEKLDGSQLVFRDPVRTAEVVRFNPGCRVFFASFLSPDLLQMAYFAFREDTVWHLALMIVGSHSEH